MDLKMSVLIVDDFSTMRRILTKALKQIGISNIIEAVDGIDALKVLHKEKINLIISDWNMPNMDGLTLLESIRSNKKLNNIPFIMVTAEGQKDSVLKAVRSGVNNYIIKPFTAESLKQKIEYIFS